MTPRRGVVWPLVLIALGALLLAANLGVIGPVRVTDVLNLWPLLLILIGVDLVLARRSPSLALALELLLVAFGLALIVVQPAYPRWLGVPAFGGTSEVSVPRGGERALALHLTGGAGSFDVHGGGGDLVKVTSDRADLRMSSSNRGGGVDVRVDEDGDRGPRFGGSSYAHVEATIASDVPTSLLMDVGAGQFTVDLSDVRVTDARLNVGAASLRLVLPKPSGDVAITISAGASSLVIDVPDGVEARVVSNGALLSTHSQNPRVTDGETAGFATAKDRVTIRITAGASSIDIR